MFSECVHVVKIGLNFILQKEKNLYVLSKYVY